MKTGFGFAAGSGRPEPHYAGSLPAGQGHPRRRALPVCPSYRDAPAGTITPTMQLISACPVLDMKPRIPSLRAPRSLPLCAKRFRFKLRPRSRDRASSNCSTERIPNRQSQDLAVANGRDSTRYDRSNRRWTLPTTHSAQCVSSAGFPTAGTNPAAAYFILGSPIASGPLE